MNQRELYFLIKFGKYKHMKALFDNGIIYMQRMRVFTEIEHAQIGDVNEGLSHTLQPDRVVVNINGQDIQSIIGPIRIIENPTYNPFIFCMYGFTNEIINESGKFINDQCLEFGESAVVVTDILKFRNLVGEAYKKIDSGHISGKLVEYVHSNKHHGEMGAFRKFSEFKHQSEFRLVYDDIHHTENAFKLNIGSLKDVAFLVSSKEINDLIKIKA